MRVLFLVSALAALVFAQNNCSVYNPCTTASEESPTLYSEEAETVPSSGYTHNARNSGFYFDMTMAGSRRHIEATKVTTSSRLTSVGCHFEPDGRYICSEEDKETSRNEKTIGYTGYGMLLGARFGGLFRGMFAAFANAELEITSGEVSGREKSEDITPRSGIFAIGPGATIYPLFYMNGPAQNVYTTATANFAFGGGGEIGLIGAIISLEVGYLWPISERFNIGVAVGGDVFSTASGDVTLEDEGGYALWFGFKLVRK